MTRLESLASDVFVGRVGKPAADGQSVIQCHLEGSTYHRTARPRKTPGDPMEWARPMAATPTAQPSVTCAKQVTVAQAGGSAARISRSCGPNFKSFSGNQPCCALRCSAQRRFWAAAMRLRASALSARLFRGAPVVFAAAAALDTDIAPDDRPPSCFLILLIKPSISFLFSSRPTKAASSVIVSGDAVRPRGMISPSALYHGLKL